MHDPWLSEVRDEVLDVGRLDFRAISTDILECRARVLVIQAARGRLRERDADPGHGSARLRGRPRDPLLPESPPDARARGSRWSEGGQLSVIMRPRRLMGTSRRPPIGWSQRAPGVRRPRVTSGLLEPRPL